MHDFSTNVQERGARVKQGHTSSENVHLSVWDTHTISNVCTQTVNESTRHTHQVYQLKNFPQTLFPSRVPGIEFESTPWV